MNEDPKPIELNWPEDVHFIAAWVRNQGVPTVHLAVELERALAWATNCPDFQGDVDRRVAQAVAVERCRCLSIVNDMEQDYLHSSPPEGGHLIRAVAFSIRTRIEDV